MQHFQEMVNSNLAQLKGLFCESGLRLLAKKPEKIINIKEEGADHFSSSS